MKSENRMVVASVTGLFFAAAGLASAQGGASPGGGKRAPTPRDIIDLEAVYVPSISPDGRTVVYQHQVADWKNNNYTSQLWVVGASGGKSFQLTFGDGGAWGGSWSPDGRSVSFLQSVGGAPQVFVVSREGGNPTQVTRAQNGVSGFKWSPDGTQIAFTTDEVARAAPDNSNEFSVMGTEAQYSSSLWVMRVPPVRGDTTKIVPERLTDGKAFAVDDAFSWSPDSREIAFSANRYDSPAPFWTYDIYVVTIAGHSVRKLVSDPGPQFFPLWSPDGKNVAFKTFVKEPGEDYYIYSIGYLATVPAAGGNSRVLTTAFDENLTPLGWGPNGIYFFARQRTYSHLFRVDPQTLSITRVTEPAVSVKSEFSFSQDFRRVAFVAQDSVQYQDVFSADVRPFRIKRLTDMRAQLVNFDIGTRELVNWVSVDGTPIEGVLVKPANFDPTKKYPLVVIPHTGPLAADQLTISRDFPYSADLYTSRGAVVLRPNYRGSIGYGARFRKTLVRNQGLPQYQDLITGVDFLIRKGFIDSSRVVAAGWSAGAYIVAFGGVWENRFKAISVLEVASDWRLFYTLGAGADVRPDYAQATPWQDPEYYRLTSPLTYINRAKTPTLIQHGDADRTAPIAGGYELHRALRDVGVPVKMVVFKGMGHVPGKLTHALAIQQQNLEWFSHYLWDTPLNW